MKSAKQVSRVAGLLMGLSLAAGSLALDSAIAAPGNGNGHGNGNSGNHGPAGSGGPGGSSGPGNSQGNIASQMGALNAAHASPAAFMHANPNSRVGKIAAYKVANAQFTAALTTALQNSPTYQAALTTFKADKTALANAQAAYAANPTPANLQAVKDAQAALDKAQADLTAAKNTVIAGDANLQNLQQAALDALKAAANKPVTASIRAALDALLANK